jgi:hypothetical protein
MSPTIMRAICFLLVVSFIRCTTAKQERKIETVDNLLIEEMYQKDIAIRELDAKTDTVNLEEYDHKHRGQIFRLLSENKVITPNDKLRAAWILQHTAAKICDGELTSLSPENFLLAYSLSSSALATLEKINDTSTIRKQNVSRIVALNYDRYSLFSFGYQKFGTQLVFDDQTGETLLAPIDTTLTTDEERKKYNVAPLRDLLQQYKMKPIGKK